jgi:mannose-6-phosphate isomerase
MTTQSESTTAVQPLLIQPRFDERIWGGHRLADEFGKAAPPDKAIGESWEIYDDNVVLNGPYAGSTIAQLRDSMGRDLTGHVSPEVPFPLLTKLIDAAEALSVQVHPDDAAAQALEGEPNGKTECWYVLEADPGAAITYGFSQDSNPDQYVELVKEGTLDRVLRSLPVSVGDVIYIPAGTVHAIGPGIVVYELQQISDVTYRIYDWNRKDAQGHSRELHVEKARQVLDYHRWTRGKVQPLVSEDGTRSMLIAARYFCEELIEVHGEIPLTTNESAVSVCALKHPIVVEAGGIAVELPRYSSLLVPAVAGSYRLIESSAGEGGRALIAYVPISQGATRTDLQVRGFSDGEIDSFLANFAPAQDLGQGVAG